MQKKAIYVNRLRQKDQKIYFLPIRVQKPQTPKKRHCGFHLLASDYSKIF